MSDESESKYLEDFKIHYAEKMKKEMEEKLSENFHLIKQFKDHCLSLGFSVSDECITYNPRIGILAAYPNILSLLSSNLKPDKEGLIVHRSLNHYTAFPPMGSFVGKNHTALVHPFFRRSHNSEAHFPPSFIARFLSFSNKDVETYVALDYDRVRIDNSKSIYMEDDYWYGPKFNCEIEKIKDGNAKFCPPSDVRRATVDWLFHDNYALIVQWSTQGHIKSFQAKAFRNENKKVSYEDTEFYPVQYLHAEYDLINREFRHFDGAIHLYNESEYFSARDLDFNHRNKIDQIKPRAKKLFKMNGKINFETWSSFVGEFLSGNPLIVEYFTGEYPQNVKDTLAMVRKPKE